MPASTVAATVTQSSEEAWATLHPRPDDPPSAASAHDSPAATQPSRTERYDPRNPYAAVNRDADSNYRYSHLLPGEPVLNLPPLQPFEHTDPASRLFEGRDTKKDPPSSEEVDALLEQFQKEIRDRGAVIIDLTPTIGTEIRGGIHISKLNDREKDLLAVWGARRGVLVFKDQDFVDQSIADQLAWGSYFGRLHIHPTSSAPTGAPEYHLVYRDDVSTFNQEDSERVTSVLWHSDVSYEQQPPGLTLLALLDSPRTGGDTIYVDQREAYRRLSPVFREFLHRLRALHSGVAQAEHSRKGNRGGVVRREPVENDHPIVRRHPITGELALYVQPQFTRRILGFKKEESDAILNFLYDHIAKGADFQVRVKWEPRAVVLWDNRVTGHTAIVDFKGNGERRHGIRITPQAERPLPPLGIDA